MGKLLEFRPKGDIEDDEDTWFALDEAGSLISYAKGAFKEDSVDYFALERCEKVIDAVMTGIETRMRLLAAGIEPPDRTYRGDDDFGSD